MSKKLRSPAQLKLWAANEGLIMLRLKQELFRA
jgi:hypothetical protein